MAYLVVLVQSQPLFQHFLYAVAVSKGVHKTHTDKLRLRDKLGETVGKGIDGVFADVAALGNGGRYVVPYPLDKCGYLFPVGIAHTVFAIYFRSAFILPDLYYLEADAELLIKVFDKHLLRGNAVQT